MENFALIHKININNNDYYLYDHIIKKFDFFKPNFKNKFTTKDFEIKFDCNKLLINKFLIIINNSSKLNLTIDEMCCIYNLLNYLSCNDENIYDRLIIDHFNLSLENIVLLLKKVKPYYDDNFVEYCFDKFVENNTTLIPFYGSNNKKKSFQNFNNSCIKYYMYEFMGKFCMPVSELVCSISFIGYYIINLKIYDISFNFDVPPQANVDWQIKYTQKKY